jgi:drug/metabolite transporter (DMT)-like permease
MVLGQVVTVFLAVVFLGERPSPLDWLGIALVIGGVATVLSAHLTGEKKTMGKRGLVFGLVSVLSMSVSYIMIKKPLESVSAMEVLLIRMAAGAAGIFVVGLATRRLGAWINPFQDLRIGGYFLLAVLVVTYGGFWLSLAAWKYADAATANTLISTEPVFALPLAAIFLKEKITVRAVAGTAVTVPGIVLLCLCRG